MLISEGVKQKNLINIGEGEGVNRATVDIKCNGRVTYYYIMNR